MTQRSAVRVIKAEACTLCRACQLTCSLLHTGSFSPDQARIRILLSRGSAGFVFEESCEACGSCSQACLYGVLSQDKGAEPGS